MRDIKFRAKQDKGKWVYGYLCSNVFGQTLIQELEETPSGAILRTSHIVDPKTVGQYTGLKDKNGKEIYEGDIIRRYTGYIFETKVRQYRLGEINQAKAHGYDWHESDEIIGNIHEHAHLLTNHPA